MFESSVEKFDEYRKKEIELGVLYPSILLHHNKKVQKCVVCFHGYTAAPEQFLALGQKLFDKGYNVYLPRLFLHGFPQKSKDTSSLTLSKLNEHLKESIDLAGGLANEVSVVGLSLGGVLSAQAINLYSNVTKAVFVSPAFGFNVGPKFLSAAVGGLLKWMPQKTKKWAPTDSEVPEFRYDEYSTLALRGILELSSEAKHEQAKLRSDKSVFILLNDADEAICNETTLEYAQGVRSAGINVEVLSLPKFYEFAHDFITPLDDGHERGWIYNLIASKL